jgi:hypothetical protein
MEVFLRHPVFKKIKELGTSATDNVIECDGFSCGTNALMNQIAAFNIRLEKIFKLKLKLLK